MIEGLKPYPNTKDSGVPWLGRVPEHWETMRGKNIFRSVDIRSTSGKEELLTVSSSRGVVPRTSVSVTMFKAESYVGYKLCWPDDLVINSLWAWGGGLGISRYHGIVSTAYGVYRLRRKYAQYAKYFHSLLRSHAFNYELRIRSKGIWISRLQLTDESFLEATLPIPPDSEQALAVRFLAHADRRIRRLIRSKQRLIALLEEQKQAIVLHAVTRGLDSSVRLKASGISWLGDIPQHWETHRVGRLFAERNATGMADLPILMVTIGHGITVGQEVDSDGKPKRLIEDRSKYKVARTGDIAYNTMRMWQGAVGVSPTDGLVSPAYVVARPRTGVCPDYFVSLFRTAACKSEIVSRSRGIVDDRNRLYWDQFKDIAVPVPPADEQDLIVTHLAERLRGHNQSHRAVLDSVGFLREFRTRLISDVVTGKIDVREAAARLPADGLEGNDPLDDIDTNTDGEEDDDSSVESGAEDSDGG